MPSRQRAIRLFASRIADAVMEGRTARESYHAGAEAPASPEAEQAPSAASV